MFLICCLNFTWGRELFNEKLYHGNENGVIFPMDSHMILLLVVGTKAWTVNRTLTSVKTIHAWTRAVALIHMAATPASACEGLVARIASWWVSAFLQFPDCIRQRTHPQNTWIPIQKLHVFVCVCTHARTHAFVREREIPPTFGKVERAGLAQCV